MKVTNRFNSHDTGHLNLKPIFLRSKLFLAITLGYGLVSISNASVPEFGAATGTEWKTSGGTLQGTRYSSLAQINASNIGQLKEEFTLNTGVSGRFMGEPLVIGSTLYVVTGFPNKLIAYNLATKDGAIKWTYTPTVSQYAKGANCCGGINRGAAYAEAFTDSAGNSQPARIVFSALDNTVIAVNANDGTLIWKNTLADPHTGVTMTVAPIIVPTKDSSSQKIIGGKVITASSSGEMGVRGWIEALDLVTGQHKWRAYNTGPDADVLIGSNTHPFYTKDQGDNLGKTSWPETTVGEAPAANKSWLLGGSSAWAYLTYDPDLNLLFYGTSQPGVWNADMRPGANKWGSSIFARNPDTGEAKWVYQVTENDSWDYDAASENISVDQKLNPDDADARKLLIHLNKNGLAYAFDRNTGEIIKAEQFVDHVNWATADDFNYATGTQAVDPNMRVHQSTVEKPAQPTTVCPSVLGAKGWEPGAYSPNTKLFYMPTFNFCSTLDALKAEFVSGAPYMGASYSVDLDIINVDLSRPETIYLSELMAWDAVKGERKWTVKEPSMIYAGILATAGDVIFYSAQAIQAAASSPGSGSSSGVPSDITSPHLKAVNAQTGDPLWSIALTCNAVGNPISFQGPDGNQRIAVFSDDSSCATKKSGSVGGQVHVYKLNLVPAP